MTAAPTRLRLVAESARVADGGEEVLNEVFAALSDPVRRSILAHLEGGELLVSEIARHFEISLQAVSKHIQVLVRAGLVAQERTGRISRCRLDAGPIFAAAVWLNRYSKYWQAQFDLLAVALAEIEDRGRVGGQRRPSERLKRSARKRRPPVAKRDRNR
jgi:DNA-binding transcriptional ArsR family regulator